MNTYTIHKYECEICGKVYDTDFEALECERVRVTQNKGAKVGTRIRVTKGPDAGKLATVECTSVNNKEDGDRYHHTVCVSARLDKAAPMCHGKFLFFDEYEIVEDGNPE